MIWINNLRQKNSLKFAYKTLTIPVTHAILYAEKIACMHVATREKFASNSDDTLSMVGI